MTRLIRAAGKLRCAAPGAVTALGLMYELVLGLADVSTPEQMSFTIFYLLGVAFVGWGAGTGPAMLVALVTAAVMTLHESSMSAPMSLGVLAWNTSTRALLFCAAGWLASEITGLNQHLLERVEARTAQLRAEMQRHSATSAQLSEALSRLQAIIGNLPMIIFAVDRKGIITFEDGRALSSLGVSPGAHVGQNILTAYGQSREVPEHMQRALRGEEFTAPVEIGSVALETWYSPTMDRDGTVCGYTGVAVNVTKQRRLERQILEISDREQARLGQEIHDGLCQQLVSLAFDANALAAELTARQVPAARIAVRISDLLDRAITDARQLARGLFPIRLDAQGLPSALEELARATQERFGVACEFESGETAPAVSKTMATHLYRIAQEAVTNAVKHARPQSINLRLENDSAQLLLRVDDDGQGIVSEKLPENGGMGLHIMDYRARSIGGRFSVTPGAQGGTTVCCCVPRQSG